MDCADLSPVFPWHAHEILFGYLGRRRPDSSLEIPNWKASLPLSGWPGYAWLGVALLLLDRSVLFERLPESAALHALTAGAIDSMTLAVMTRASLGHTGREIVADRAVVTPTSLRERTAPLAEDWYAHLLACGGAL